MPSRSADGNERLRQQHPAAAAPEPANTARQAIDDRRPQKLQGIRKPTHDRNPIACSVVPGRVASIRGCYGEEEREAGREASISITAPSAGQRREDGALACGRAAVWWHRRCHLPVAAHRPPSEQQAAREGPVTGLARILAQPEGSESTLRRHNRIVRRSRQTVHTSIR